VIFAAAVCLRGLAGGSPAAGYFSCSAKKSNQKKAAPVRRSFGLPCAARPAGRLRNSRAGAMNFKVSGRFGVLLLQRFERLAQCSPTAPGATPLLGGSQGVTL